MAKVDSYKEILKKLPEWDSYLLAESGLPGPRGNLELLEAVSEVGSEALFKRYLTFDPEKAPTGTAEEFIAVCGVVGLGQLIKQGQTDYLPCLRSFAQDPRWRVREGVAIALQIVGSWNMKFLLHEMDVWSRGDFLEKRAVAAAVCEPKLLKDRETVSGVLNLLDRITEDLLHAANRKDDNFKVLRKTLGYGWSVAVVAGPEKGKALLEKWFSHEDKDIRWIMKENLRKDRLSRMDKEWTGQWRQVLGVGEKKSLSKAK
ncbi:hypothetical protein Desor_2181 [Desulfosporosinus orientis DSM 765]|uniref:HEAT repeat domain-containing protein n=1 Tax=Desulfosporosinus orientis (strain ATCC 19365 / DSM 765 / NCIMB 8382 / VKM B-1628 / Singapore I) TaxID=768706 RepID=G7W8S4_DESOD|nr:hypothetical protein [Desulfosporosinus orientis]AET67784.1 hypothetical protein Desor_2181 [Desulfosporosinus orientis DSM 765]